MDKVNFLADDEQFKIRTENLISVFNKINSKLYA